MAVEVPDVVDVSPMFTGENAGLVRARLQDGVSKRRETVTEPEGFEWLERLQTLDKEFHEVMEGKTIPL